MAIKVLGILGSPRRGGNTEILLDEALAGARSQGAETEKLVVSELKIAPCQNCDDCALTGECTIHDEMDEIYHKLQAIDRLVLASPIFFLSVTAQTKVMIDRCQSLWVTKYVLKQPITKKRRQGLFISTAHSDNPRQFQGAIIVVRAFFTTLEIDYEAELLFGGIQKKGEVLKHPTALRDVFAAGVRLASHPMKCQTL